MKGLLQDKTFPYDTFRPITSDRSRMEAPRPDSSEFYRGSETLGRASDLDTS